MNFKLYIFGESSGYKQYPDDSINFKEWFKNQQGNALLNIKREADLVYYIYTRATDKQNKSFLGFCLVFNGIYIKNLQSLFSLFEKAYSDCILNGKLFKINETGKIEFATNDFSSQKDEIDRIKQIFDNKFNKKRFTLFAALPPTYKTGQGTKSFSISDNSETISNAISIYDSISIPYDTNDNNLDYIGKMLQQLYAENKTLQSKYATLNRQKKQYRWVAILSVAVVASLIGLYFLNDNLSGVISNQSNTIQELESTIANQSSQIKCLNDTLSSERSVIEQKDDEIQSLQSSLSSCQNSLNETKGLLSSIESIFPIKITSIEIGNSYKGGQLETDYGYTIYSENSMFLKPQITYTGINTGHNINLKVKWYTPDGDLSVGNSSPDGFSLQTSIYVYSGTNTITLSGWGNERKGNWEKGTYRIEIWYRDVCLKAETFRLH